MCQADSPVPRSSAGFPICTLLETASKGKHNSELRQYTHTKSRLLSLSFPPDAKGGGGGGGGGETQLPPPRPPASPAPKRAAATASPP